MSPSNVANFPNFAPNPRKNTASMLKTHIVCKIWPSDTRKLKDWTAHALHETLSHTDFAEAQGSLDIGASKADDTSASSTRAHREDSGSWSAGDMLLFETKA